MHISLPLAISFPRPWNAADRCPPSQTFGYLSQDESRDQYSNQMGNIGSTTGITLNPWSQTPPLDSHHLQKVRRPLSKSLRHHATHLHQQNWPLILSPSTGILTRGEKKRASKAVQLVQGIIGIRKGMPWPGVGLVIVVA